MKAGETASARALQWSEHRGPFIRAKEAVAAGIHSRTLARLKKEGKLEQVSRGVYRPKTLKPLTNPALVTVSVTVPNAVVCLISSLSFHRLTTQIPHEVSIALPEKSRTPKISYPLMKAHRFGGKAYEEGIEVRKIDDVDVRIYSAEKTIADCFKFRNKIGLDIFLEAVKMYRSKKRKNIDSIIKYARICRVEKQIRPYLEATVGSS